MRIRKARLIALIVGVVGLVGPLAFLPLIPWLVSVFERMSHWGFWGPAALAGFCAASCVLMIPASIATLAAGFFFGVPIGSAIAVIGTTIGACAAFLVSRVIARDWWTRKVTLGGRLAALDRAVGEQGFKIVLLIRLSPISPFIALNYAFGLTRVSLWKYAGATLIGGVPGTVLFVFFGAGLHSLHELVAYAGGHRPSSLANHIFFWAGLGVTLAISVGLTRVAGREIRKAMPKDPQEKDEDSTRQKGDSLA